jgi:hypothetical protein
VARKPFLTAPEFKVSEDSILVQQVNGSTVPLFEVKTISGSSTAVAMSVENNGALSTDGRATTLTTNSATTVFSFSTTDYRSGEFLIQVTQGTNYTVSKVMVLHNGATPYINEFGVLEIGAPRIPLTISATISGGNVLLQAAVTDALTTTATVKVFPVLIKV